ncbi:MAG TPA: N-acetyl-gamma-glutamyl-phosphate reductase [Cyclobacteriaceae bacterium]|nr:N-acetyl-gamma-glutamyl-phosphate reductase [Cyclobacteriaceae bacterium]
MSRYKVGIIGGAGFTAGELIRILYRHPDVDISFIVSESHAGNQVSDVHDDLSGLLDMAFVAEPDFNVDVLFLCKGHGESVQYLRESKTSSSTKIIDLSQDFRLKESYPDLQGKYGDFVYGLSELNYEEISKSRNVANPGCFATCVQLGLLPLAHAGSIEDDIQISAITGSTGAGQKITDTSHFSWRNNNVSVYKPFQHQHLSEIRQTLELLQKGFSFRTNFIPYRGNFTRGILAAMYLRTGLTLFDIRDLYGTYYRNSYFIKISPRNIHLKQVVNTNNCFIYLEKFDDQLLIISAIDNLLKGASGQAVQNMNIMLGLKENTGLDFKASAF